MNDQLLLYSSIVSVLAATTRRIRLGSLDDRTDGDSAVDRGAVSIEQVLWYAAAAVSVAIVATIIWTQIRTTASTPVDTPTAP